MIEGIEILKKTEIMDTELLSGWWVPLLVAIIIIALFATVFVTICIKEEEKKKYEPEPFSSFFQVFTLFGVGAVIIYIALEIASNNYVLKTPSGKYEYEVVFESQDAFYEAYEQYDIVGVNEDYEDVAGKIYTIRDKEE